MYEWPRTLDQEVPVSGKVGFGGSRETPRTAQPLAETYRPLDLAGDATAAAPVVSPVPTDGNPAAPLVTARDCPLVTVPYSRDDLYRMAQHQSVFPIEQPVISGAAVAAYRRHHGLTQADLGQLVGLDRHIVSYVELGQHMPILTNRRKLAALLNGVRA